MGVKIFQESPSVSPAPVCAFRPAVPGTREAELVAIRSPARRHPLARGVSRCDSFQGRLAWLCFPFLSSLPQTDPGCFCLHPPPPSIWKILHGGVRPPTSHLHSHLCLLVVSSEKSSLNREIVYLGRKNSRHHSLTCFPSFFAAAHAAWPLGGLPGWVMRATSAGTFSVQPRNLQHLE